MRIDDRSTAGPANVEGSRVHDAKAAGSARPGPALAKGQSGLRDSVSFGEGRTLIQRAIELGTAQREQHVAEVRAALEGGWYEMDPASISQAMVGEMLQSGMPGR